MLTLMFSTALAIALLLSYTQTGKVLRDMLIDLPARQLAKLTPARIALAVFVIAAIAGLIAFAKSDGLMLVAQGVPEAIGVFATFDVATYVDVIGMLLLLAAAVRVRAALQASCAVAARSWRWLLRCTKRLSSVRHRAMARRRRPRKTAPRPSDGDDRGWCTPAYSWA
jgi:E3 ubiquitin-protein ligase DOA10